MQYRAKHSHALILFCVLAASHVLADAPPTPQSLVLQVADRLDRAERSVRNVYVEGTVSVDETAHVENELVPEPGARRTWARTPIEMKSAAWFGSAIDGPYRVDADRDVNVWFDGPKGAVSYADSKYSVVFDGTQYAWFESSFGVVGETVPTGRGKRSDSVDEDVRWLPIMRIGAGVQFTPLFWDRSRKMTLSAYLKAFLGWQNDNRGKLPPILEAQFQTVDGRKLLKIKLGYVGYLAESWTFDCDRGWSILAYERRSGKNLRLDTYFHVSELKQVTDTFWYPTAAEAYEEERSDMKDGRRPVRNTFKATTVGVNKAEYDQRIRDFEFPPNTIVTDETTRLGRGACH